MCIIIQGKTKDFTKKILSRAYSNNADGFGLMYLKNNKIVAEKIYPKTFKDVRKLFKKHRDLTEEIALHFRICTNGNKNKFNSHPFNVFDYDFKYQMFLMHNSPQLPCYQKSKKYSDTFYFTKQILSPILTKDISLLKKDSFKNTLEEIINIETDSKILLLDTYTNKYTFLGKWYEEKDQLKSLKISNTYGLQERTYFAGWSSGTPSKEISPVGITSDTTIDYLNTDSEKSKNSDAQSDINSNFSSYKDTNSTSLYKEELKEQYEDMIEILENGELSDYQKLMEEKPILLAKLLREYFVNGNQLNDEKDIDKINEETIKHYG